MSNGSARPTFQLDSPLTAERVSNALGRLLPLLPHTFWKSARWFGNKAREIDQVTVRDRAIFTEAEPIVVLTLVDIAFQSGDPETYFVPLAVRREETARGILAADEGALTIGLEASDGSALVYDALADNDFCGAMFRAIALSSSIQGVSGTFQMLRTRGQNGWLLRASAKAPTPIRRLRLEQSNTSVVFGNDYVLKAFRKLQPGINPDVEVTRFLTITGDFRDMAPLAGHVEYAADGFSSSVAMLQRFVPNDGDCWEYTLEHLAGFLRQARHISSERVPSQVLLELARSLAAPYFDEIASLGRSTGELHHALSCNKGDNAFAPEAVTRADLEGWVRNIDTRISAALDMISRENLLPNETTQAVFQRVIEKRSAYRGMVKGLLALGRTPLTKIRIHGDYHLGQVLHTDDRFVVLDFEGEPGSPIAERRGKQLALKDIAGMLRSFNYAAQTALRAAPGADGKSASALGDWAKAWEAGARCAFVEGYLQNTLTSQAPFLPRSRPLIELALSIFELDKAVYELQYEANNRPDWLGIPLQYIAEL